MSPSGISRLTRVSVWLFLAAFGICGVFGFELWPMTGWRLFADARKQHDISWSAKTEYSDGTTGNLVLRSAGSSDTPFLIGRFGEIPLADREHLCKEWLDVSNTDVPIHRILIYRTTRDLGIRTGDQSEPPTHELVYVCQDSKLSAIDS